MQSIKWAKIMALFYIFVNIFNVCLIEDRKIFMFLHSHILGCFRWNIWRKLGSHKFSCKGRSIFIVFSGNCGYSLVLQYSKGDSFLKVSCIVESETHIKELFVSFTLKSIGLFYNEFFTCLILWHAFGKFLSLPCLADSSKCWHI